jgi:hypothetical protein
LSHEILGFHGSENVDCGLLDYDAEKLMKVVTSVSEKNTTFISKTEDFYPEDFDHKIIL